MSLRDDILQAAPTLSGMRYRLDPPPDLNDGTIDCSLFVMEAYRLAGVPFSGVRTAEQIRQACVPIGWDEILPGDLLFFEQTYDAAGPAGPDGKIASHVGISLGAGTKRMWDAHDRNGNDVAITDISTDYWQEHIFEARRPPQLLTTSPGGPVTTPTMPRGIDVSSNNGAIDWPAVAAGGIQFAICKATGGTWYRNPRFASDWLAMQAAGLVRGAYHYAFETSGQAFPGDGPEAEADYFLAEVARGGGLQAGDLLALDIEEGSGDLGGWALAFVRRVESRVGFRPLVYTSAGFAQSHGFASQPALGEAGLWLAAWTATQPDPPAPWALTAIWQYTDAGDVPGISGRVDLDQFNGTIDRLPLYGQPAASTPADPPPTPPAAITRAEIDAIIATLTDWRARTPA